MKQRLKQYLLIAAAAALLWFVLGNHFVFKGNSVHLLKKSTLDLHDTFVSLDNKRPESIMRNERLRDAGIGELMVELEIITEDEKSRIEDKLSYTD
jgi:hypothetical protein